MGYDYYCAYCGTGLTIYIEYIHGHKTILDPCSTCGAMWECDGISGNMIIQGYEGKSKDEEG